MALPVAPGVLCSWWGYFGWSFPGGSEVKVYACNAGDLGSIPGSGRSPGKGNGNPLQYSCLENLMDGGAWWAIVHGVAKSQTRLSDFTSLHFTSEKSSVIALPSKGGHSGLMPSECVSQLGEGSKKFYTNGSKRAWSAHGLSFDGLGMR